MAGVQKQVKDYVLNSSEPGALYSLHRLKKVPNLKFDDANLLKAYEESDTLRQFYNTSKQPKSKTVRNAFACYPLERIHIDLCEMTDKRHGESVYRYILFAIDNYSRYVFYVFLKSKQATEMESAATSLLKQMAPFRKLSLNKSSTFFADLGTEFITKFKQKLLQTGHFFVNLASSESKAFYAERFIRTYRHLLKVKQTSTDLQKKVHDSWESLTPDIIKIYNSSPHASLNFKSPSDFIQLEKSTIQYVNSKKRSLSKGDFIKSINSETTLDGAKNAVTTLSETTKFKIDDYVRITKTKKNIFSKGSETPNVSLEIFKVFKIRHALFNSKKLPLYFLKDMLDKPIMGGFREDELVFVKPSSIHHPSNPKFQKSIRTVVKKIAAKNSESEKFKVNFNGKFYILFFPFFYLTCCPSQPVDRIVDYWNQHSGNDGPVEKPLGVDGGGGGDGRHYY